MRVMSNRYNTHKHVLFNKRINDNLEQQAQALFKSWFVDFETVAKMVNSWNLRWE